MIGVWQADMGGLSGKSKSARIVAEAAPARHPMIGKIVAANVISIALAAIVSKPIHNRHAANKRPR
jgi:hypothetical protein